MATTPAVAPGREPISRRAAYGAFGAVAVFVVVGLVVHRRYDLLVTVVSAAVALGVTGVLTVRRPRPLLGYAAAATAAVAVLGNGTSSDIEWFALVVLAAWCLLVGTRREGVAYWVGTLLLFGVEWLWVQRDPGWGAWAAGVTCAAVAAAVVTHEMDLVAQLRAAQAGLADRARVEERNRIARELHDVIAHSLTVSLLHVSSARLAVESDPADAVRALSEAERLGRESLAEVRSAVGMLRVDDEGSDGVAAPLPGIDGIPALIDRYRAAGADVAFTSTGETDGLAATTGLAVYRILQEALTNAVRHAAGTSVSVSVTAGPAYLGLTVQSSGPPGHGRGLGLVSMRERAEALGGTCQAGPDGIGWAVRATLPRRAGRPQSLAT